MIKQIKSNPPIIYHFDFRQIIFLNVRNGDENQRNDVSGRIKNKINSFFFIEINFLNSYWGGSNFGFSFGSSRPRPDGLSRASSSLKISSSISTFPYKNIIISYEHFTDSSNYHLELGEDLRDAEKL